MPTLRRVISFDTVGSDVTLFGDLLSSPAVAQDTPGPAPADLSTIGYTSGTTGHPKGAMQSHRAVFLNRAAVFAVQTRTERDVMRPHLAAYKRPRSVRFVPDLPKTSTGKVMRRQLKTLDG